MIVDGILARTDRLQGLLPAVRDKAMALLETALDEHIILRVTQGLRTYAEQNALYAQGRTLPGPRVTNAPGGYSWHNFGRAFDVCIVSYIGDTTPRDVYDGPWQHIAELGEKAGLEWGGRFPSPDSPHFEDRGGLTLAQARAAA